MSYNGSGTFNINTTGQPVVAGTVISSSAFNALTTDLATGLTTAITKDGQTTTTARITFAQGITSSLVTDSSSVSTGSIITGGGVGIAKALYVGTTANVAGAVTLGGIATFSAQPIFSSLTASSAVATDASKGLVSVTNTGTGNNVLATSPTITTPVISSIVNTGTLTLPTSTDTLVGRATTDTLTNKTLTTPVISSLSSASATALTLQSAGTTAITVDTSQNVGIGTVSPTAKLTIDKSSDSASPSRTPADYSIRMTAAQSNTYNGGICVSEGTFVNSAITPIDTGSGGAQGWAFITGDNTSIAERARVDTSGNLLVGFTSGTATPAQGVGIAGQASAGVYIGHANGTPTGNYYQAYSYNGSAIGSITQNGTTGVLFNITSDYRLKNNPVALTGAKDFVMALQPKTWDWWDDSGKGVGFIAHEFMEVAKYSGQGKKDAIDDDGKPIHQSIQPSSSEVMANIVALVQEQQATINALTARITALENA